MKNTLAENMLRFGVKNLSELDVKKINESLLTEDFANPEDGLTYKLNFKNVQAFNLFISAGARPNGALPAPWVKQMSTQQNADPNYDNSRQASSQVEWIKECNNVIQSLWLAMAFLGRQPKSINNTFAKQTAAVFINSATPQLTQFYNKLPIFLPYANESLADKKWDTLIADPIDKTGKTKITYWAYFVRTFLVPNVAAKQALIIAPVAQAAPGTAKPGTVATKN
jgi:hypothetical protein